MGRLPDMDYTIKNLRGVEDMAASQGFGEAQEARFAHGDLDSEQSGISLQRVKPGKRHSVAHRHKEMEEIYVVISGSGRIKLDDKVEEVGPLDAIRIGPSVTRSLEAGDEGLEFLAFSPRAKGDAEIVEGFSWD
jgi:mannose-6-phosphate isomerase-like protein (cupin superfamily)